VTLSDFELRSLARRGEGPRVEFKRVLPVRGGVARTLCAFANGRGGVLLVGVTDRGTIHGLHRADVVAREVREAARLAVDPPVPIDCAVAAVDGSRLVVCRVHASERRPHAHLDPRGGREVVVRVGASNRRAEGATLRALARQPTVHRRLGELERTALRWILRSARSCPQPGGSATLERFARAHNVGLRRARRCLEGLVRDGLLVAHGNGAARVYALA